MTTPAFAMNIEFFNAIVDDLRIIARAYGVPRDEVAVLDVRVGKHGVTVHTFLNPLGKHLRGVYNFKDHPEYQVAILG
jgi:hypothetical protein